MSLGGAEEHPKIKKEEKPFGDVLLAFGLLNSAVIATCILLFVMGGPLVQKAGLSALIASAAGSIGSITGFLFGVPKAMARTSDDPIGPRYESNSNLEQISDWVTKILVGIGLAEFRSISAGLWDASVLIGRFFGDAVGNPGIGATYVLSLIIFSFSVTFLLMYMWTRTRVFQIFHRYSDSSA